MDNNYLINNVPNFKEKKIIARSILSKSFGMKCEKVILEDNSHFVVKYIQKKNVDYNPIINEAKSLIYMYKKFKNFFPKTYYYDKNILVMEYIENNGLKGKNYQKELALILSKIHKKNNTNFGFDFDTPIGGLRQPSKFSNNWIKFYKENRLGMIFELINKKNPMPNETNRNIEKIIKNLDQMLPKNPIPSLLHGDLWEGNILFNNEKIVGFIDPGVHFGHNELEIAYLTWFKYVNNEFLNYYSDIINIDKYYKKYEPIYQLYYCLLNVHLWDREYINNTNELIKKILKN